MKCEPSECSDGELAALTLAGRHDAFAEIMRRHEAAIYRLVRGYTGDADDALDLVQDCFVAAYKALERYDQARPFRAWLARIAINKCRDWSRRRLVRRIFQTADGTAVAAVADTAPGVDVAVADREELDLLWKLVAELPRALKEPLILRTIEGLSQAETASVLRISEKAVETRLYRARRRLAELRDGEGGVRD